VDLGSQVRVFKSLGEPTRLKIVRLLSGGELCVCKIIPETGKSQPTVSAHLKILYDAGLVKSRKEGLSVYYSLSGDWIKELLEFARGC
jgi:DNA-binding transcriptional ArsR family regulator